MIGEQLNIQWQRGNFNTYYALMKIRVGGANPIDVQAGESFEYDGTVLKYAGHELPSTATRGAFKSGWCSVNPPDGYERVPPKVTARNVAKAKTINRDLANVQRNEARSVETDSLDEETVFDVAARRPGAQDNPRAAPRVMTRADNQRARTAGMRVESDGLEEQDGVDVGRVKIKANTGPIDITLSKNAGLADKLENTVIGGKQVRPPRGRTVHQEGVTIGVNVGSMEKDIQIDDDSDTGVPVAKVRHTPIRTAEGITVKDTSNIRYESKGPKGPVERPAASKVKAKVDPKLPPKVRIARSIDPSFPADWSFQGKLADRLAAVKKHGTDPTFLEALYAAEGDQMRKQMEKAFPKQFGG